MRGARTSAQSWRPPCSLELPFPLAASLARTTQPGASCIPFAGALELSATPPARDAEAPLIIMELMNRNKRRPTKANHGARPCSSYARRARRPKGTNSGRRRGN
jgi:hypothetical protein